MKKWKSSIQIRHLWLRATPFFLSAALFLSFLFSVFAPLPLLVERYQGAPLWKRILETFLNLGLVFLLVGVDGTVLYLWLVLPVAWVLPLLLERVRKAETAAFLTLLCILGLGLAVLVGESLQAGSTPWDYVRHAVDEGLRRVHDSVPLERRGELLGDLSLDEWMRGLRNDLPWRIVTLSLLWVFANTMILLRWNPRHLRERLGLEPRFFATWKAPEALIWPVIVFAGMSLLGKGGVASVGTNALFCLLAVFGIQGLSILSFMLDLWKIHGPMRSLAYVLALLVMLPLVLAIGFFDTWFDFRARLRQR
jgi:hypothetical protein